MRAEEFLSLMEPEKDKNIDLKFGYIDCAYTTGRPRVKLDGTDNTSVKSFPFLSSYTPVANDRVMLIKGVVLGKIV